MSTQVPPTPPRPSRSSQRIRPYQAEDWDAVYDICVRTGAMGEDARGLLADRERAAALGAAARAELLSTFTWDARAARILRRIAELRG